MRLVALMLVALVFAGCASDSEPDTQPDGTGFVDEAPFLDYEPTPIDENLMLLMEDVMLPGSTDNVLHARITRPVGEGPFPVIVQHTPYTAPGCATQFYGVAVEPPVIGGNVSPGCGEGRFEQEFVRRGYAYVHADLRGTGDSDDCLDLRGPTDIADIGALADALAAQPWSNGNVGFIGASYPGSTSHMAALSGSPAVKAVVPIVASTSFYHYHHNSGVPYNGQHSLGGTNSGYTQEGVTPTVNPATAAGKLADQPFCPHAENALEHGGLDQTGTYYDWWQARNLRPLASTITVPVLMAQGLADWNVKPDHVATWFNDIQSESKTFIGGQWGHAYPATGDGACREGDDTDACSVPWDDWWVYATAFFDTYLKELDTGMFEGSTAWVQDNNRTWHRSTDWPLLGAPSVTIDLLSEDMRSKYAAIPAGHTSGLSWYACPGDTQSKGTAAGLVEEAASQCANQAQQSLVFETAPMVADMLVSGVPLVNLTLHTEGKPIHLVAVVDVLEGNTVVSSRENYGYLNPTFRHGIDHPEPVPSGTYNVTIDLYPQEDLLLEGQSLRITLASKDGGRTVEEFDEGIVSLDDAVGANSIYLPLRPSHLQGVRL